MERGQIDQNLRADFILAGNSLVTFKSLRTGKHYTYKVRKKKTENIWFVSVLYDPSGQNYNYIGCITREGKFVHTKKSQIGEESESFQAFKWVWYNRSSDRVEVWHEGKCGRCGRTLTEPESIKRGFGPICWQK